MTSTHPTGLIEKLRKLAFPARDISDGMPMGEAVRLDQIEETIRQHFAAPEVVEAVAEDIEDSVDDTTGEWTDEFKRYVAKSALAAALGEKE